MTFEDYQKLAARTINKNLKAEEMLFHSLFGMASEVGELQSIYQKYYQGHKLDEEHLIKELGDILWFIAEWCTANNLNMDDVAQTNIDKLKARYSQGFAEENSLHRQKGDI